MKRPIPGRVYRFVHKETWTLKTDPVDSSFGHRILQGEIITCLHEDLSVDWEYTESRPFEPISVRSTFKRAVGVWLVRGMVLYDMPISAIYNGGMHEDNLASWLEEV